MKVTGIALKPHTETVGQSGIKKVWPEDVLRKSTPTLNGCPVYAAQGRSPDDVIGSVLEASYDEGVGVRYEALIEDDEIATKFEEGEIELAPRGHHESIDGSNHTATEVSEFEFTGLFVTQQPTDAVPGKLMVDGVLQPSRNR